MAITQGIANQAKADFLGGIHSSSDTYKIALYTSAAVIGPTTSTYTATGEVSGTGYTAGGATLSGFNATLSGTTGVLDFTTDPTWPSSTITARGFMIYNSTESNKVLYIGDFGSDITSTADTFTVTFPVPDDTTGLIRIA
jgi:hypothetical protein